MDTWQRQPASAQSQPILGIAPNSLPSISVYDSLANAQLSKHSIDRVLQDVSLLPGV